MQPSNPKSRTLSRILVGGTAATAAAGAAGLAWSALAVNHRMTLPDAIAATRRTFQSPTGGRLSFYLSRHGAGRPLLLLHSVNAAASACEMQPLFDRYRGERPVYAPDLPGFGFSERRDRVYTPDLYADTLSEFIQHHVAEYPGGADVVALSLSCEFVALAASRRPALFHSLVFLSPTGFSGTGQPRSSAKLHRLVTFPLWSQAFYDLLVSRPSIRYYLQKSFAGPVNARLATYDYLTAHQPGARHAPFHFLSGHLFNPQIRDIYARLTMPVLVIANPDGYVNFDHLPGFAAAHPHFHVARISNARSMPHFENSLETSRRLLAFWQSCGAITSPAPAHVPQPTS